MCELNRCISDWQSKALTTMPPRHYYLNASLMMKTKHTYRYHVDDYHDHLVS